MGVTLAVEERTFAGAVVGRVALRDDDPVPVKLLEIDDERVSAAAALGADLVAVSVDRSPRSCRRLILHVHHQIGLLNGRDQQTAAFVEEQRHNAYVVLPLYTVQNDHRSSEVQKRQ